MRKKQALYENRDLRTPRSASALLLTSWHGWHRPCSFSASSAPPSANGMMWSRCHSLKDLGNAPQIAQKGLSANSAARISCSFRPVIRLVGVTFLRQASRSWSVHLPPVTASARQPTCEHGRGAAIGIDERRKETGNGLDEGQKAESPPLQRAQTLSFTGSAASSWMGDPYASAQSLREFYIRIFLPAISFHAFRLISICRPSRNSIFKPAMLVPIAWHARRGLTGLT